MDIGGAFRLLRPGNAAVSAAAAYVGALLAVAPFAPTLSVLAAMVAAFCFAAAGNVRNDLGDVDVDRRAHPDRPLVTGEIAPQEARILSVVLYGTALVAGALVSFLGLLLVLLALPIMEGYERWGKARGLPGNLLVAFLTMAPFVLGALAGTGLNAAVLTVALLAALATAAREVLKDVEDMGADRGARVTLPMRIGARPASLVAAALLVGAVLLSPLPWLLENVLGGAYLAAVGAADLCFLAAAYVGVARPGRAQRLAKLGMVAALVALVIGRAQVGGA